MKYLTSVSVIWYREVLRQWRDKTRLIAALAMPLLFIFVFGQGIASSLGKTAPFDYIDFMFPGVVGMTVMMTGMFSSISLVFDREFGFLREILVAPIPRSSVVLGKILGSSTIATFQGALMLAVAPLIGVSLSWEVIIKILPLMFLLAFSITSFGVAIAARIQTVQAFQYIMPVVMMPLLFLSGAFFPLTDPPIWLSILAKADPVTYGIDMLRNVFLGGGESSPVVSALLLHPLYFDILVVLGFSTVMFTLALFSFREK